MPNTGTCAASADFELGSIRVRPRARVIEAASRSVTVEPLVMQLLVALSRRAGQLVTRREIFALCWGTAPAGDDSLNRIVAVLRKALQGVGGNAVRIETVPSAGYVLRLAHDLRGVGPDANRDAQVQRAIDGGFDSWRLALPEPDHLAIEQLRGACALAPSNARAWGMLALLCRHAAEYGGPAAVSDYVRECEAAAKCATALDPQQPEALTALVSVVPLFGGWTAAREQLVRILDVTPDSVVAAQDLATLEMATGRIRAGKALRDRLVASDPLAAVFCYKSVYQHWAVGDLLGMDHVADRAMQLWPTHPAVWMVRLWTLAYTGRVPAALDMLDDRVSRPDTPAVVLTFLRHVLTALHSGEIDAATEASVRVARTGPANAMAALFALRLLDRPDDLFEVAEAYYVRCGSGPVPVRHTDSELSLNEQHRRLTQVLFMPVFAGLRADKRFMAICERTGLCRHWIESGIRPDFMNEVDSPAGKD